LPEGTVAYYVVYPRREKVRAFRDWLLAEAAAGD